MNTSNITWLFACLVQCKFGNGWYGVGKEIAYRSVSGIAARSQMRRPSKRKVACTKTAVSAGIGRPAEAYKSIRLPFPDHHSAKVSSPRLGLELLVLGSLDDLVL